jgi:phosphoglycolate phosphatase
MPAYNLALLDFDGTLADSAASIVHCVQRTFEHYGENIPAGQEIRATIGLPLAVAMVELRGKGGPEDGEAWAETYREIFREEGMAKLRMFEGAGDFLQGLADKGVPATIVSARKAELTRDLLMRFKLDHLLQAVHGDTPQGPNKPDPRVYQELILPKFGCNGDLRPLMIGDTHIDLRFAKNIKAGSCWASYGYGSPTKCRALRPDHEAQDLAQALKLF